MFAPASTITFGGEAKSTAYSSRNRIAAYVEGSVVRTRRCTGFRMFGAYAVISLGYRRRRYAEIAKTPRPQRDGGRQLIPHEYSFAGFVNGYPHSLGLLRSF